MSSIVFPSFKYGIIALSYVLLLVPVLLAQKSLKSEEEKESYALGFNIGNSFKQQGITPKLDVFFEAIKVGLDGKQPLMEQQEIIQALTSLQEKTQKRHAAQKNVEALENKKKSFEFLQKNKIAKGVKTLPSGLQYKVVTDGKGELPKATDTVKVHYKGTLIDGTEFDSSYTRGAPAEFPVNRVIPGWTEALQKMKVGSTWELVIPSVLAYGDNPPQGSVIPAGAALLFTVELLEIKK